MKKKLFNIVVYTMLAYSIFSALRVAQPEWFAWLPEQFNELTALISGGSMAFTGTTGLLVNSFIAKARVEADTKYNGLQKDYEVLGKSQVKVSDKQDIIIKQNDRIIKLLTADLEAKRSDKLVDKETKRILGGVLDEEEMDK